MGNITLLNSVNKYWIPPFNTFPQGDSQLHRMGQSFCVCVCVCVCFFFLPLNLIVERERKKTCKCKKQEARLSERKNLPREKGDKVSEECPKSIQYTYLLQAPE